MSKDTCQEHPALVPTQQVSVRGWAAFHEQVSLNLQTLRQTYAIIVTSGSQPVKGRAEEAQNSVTQATNGVGVMIGDMTFLDALPITPQCHET